MSITRRESPNLNLLFFDLCSIIVSYLLADWIRYGNIMKFWFRLDIYGEALGILLLLYIAIYYLTGNYERMFKRGFLEEMIAVIKINFVLAVSLTGRRFVFQGRIRYSRLFFLCFFLLNILITYIVRQYYKLLLQGIHRKSSLGYKVMLLTTLDQAGKILTQMRNENNWEYQVTYLTILDRSMVGQTVYGLEVKADFQNMFEVAKNAAVDGVFIHIPNEEKYGASLEEVILEFQNMGLTVDLSINTFGLKISEKVVREVSGYHVLTFSSRLFTESQMLVKRAIDVAGGLVGCMVTMLLTIFIAPAIYLESPGPIFFSQVRIGRNGRRFKIYKFRSMYMDAELRKAELMEKNEMKGLMFKIKDDPRVTRVGRFLRKTSLDEFPQFFNVIKGDMSLVGTRPPTENEFIQYEKRHRRRLALKAGVTGLWQVSGRSDINDFEDVVKMDLEYIDNWSIKMDVKILFKTIGVVIFGKGSR